MGLFDAILPFGDREMAMSLKKHAISTSLTSHERDLVSKLKLEPQLFVGERILLLSSFIRACLIHLGDSQGNKLVSMVRKDEVHKDIPIIIITTEGAQEDRQRALSLGANAYITKPIQAPQVISKVKDLLKLA